MAKKIKTQNEGKTNPSPIEELESLKAQRKAAIEKIRSMYSDLDEARAQKKEIQGKIKAFYGNLVESHKATKAAKAKMQIVKLEERLEALKKIAL
jgi:septation ring formation regulator EzrA